MNEFFNNVDWGVARRLEALARLSLELREAHKDVLRHYGVADAAELVARIAAGHCPEHPAWEHALGLRVLAETRESVRRMIAAGGRDDGEVLPWHLVLQAEVAQSCADACVEPPAVSQDALRLHLRGDVLLEVHFAAADAYSLRWHCTGTDGQRREAGIDTAPGHPWPSHLHRADGQVVADALTRADATPEANLQAVIAALLANPRYALED